MGTQKQRTLFYFAAGLALIFWIFSRVGGLSPQRVSWLGGDSVETPEPAAERNFAPRIAAPKSQWKRVSPRAQKVSENTYQPTTNFVNSYTPSAEYQHPLVASTKFISKKEQKKKKNAKKNKLAQQAKKEKSEKSSREFGLSDSEDDFDPSPNSSTAPVLPPTANTRNNAQNQTPANNEEQEENLNSVEYWEKPIFIDEDVAMVSKLIESYQVRKVSNSIFYDLVTEMRQDERVQVRQFGLTALTSTPSARSFYELALMKSSDPDADLRLAANKELSNYAQEKKLTHLVSTLKGTASDSTKPTFEALVVLDQASKKYSDLVGFGSGSSPASATTLSNVKPRFEQALNLIEQNKLTESSDAQVKTQALQTEVSLTNFLATTQPLSTSL